MAIVHVTDASFEQEVVKSDKPVLVDFWAEWCGPCRVMEPILDEISAENAEKLTVAKLNVDENPMISQQFQIMSIPTMLLFKNGQPVEQLVGSMPKDAVMGKLTPALG